MNRFLFLVIVLSTGIFVGCANTGAQYRPIVDLKTRDANAYEKDLRECQSYATQTADAGQSAAAGAVAGALIGGLLAAAAGSRYDQGGSARVGAISGAIGAGAQGEKDQREIIRRCLAGRGYQVLQ